jgi:hypothetical protein
MRKACEIATDLVTLAGEHGDTRRNAEAEHRLATVRTYSGDFDLADEGWERAWALLKSMQEPATGLIQRSAGPMPRAQTAQVLGDGQAFNRIYSAWIQWFLGYPDRALERASIATAIARESGLKSLQADVQYHAADVFELCSYVGGCP